MDLLQLIRILRKRIWFLVIFPVVAVPLVFVMTADQPKFYTSYEMVSMGLNSSSVSLTDNSKVYVRVQQINNMLELANSRTVFTEVGYHLLYDQLTNDSLFLRVVGKNEIPFAPADSQKIITILEKIINTDVELPANSEENNLLTEFLMTNGFDFRSLRGGFSIYQLDESDFIRISFKAELPEFVVHALHTFTDVFIRKYKKLVSGESIRSREFFETQVEQIRQNLHDKEKELETFKKENNIILLSEQIKSVVGQLDKFENLLNDTEQKIETIKASIWKIESLLSNYDNSMRATEAALLNTEMLQLTNEIKNLESEYIIKKYKQNQDEIPQLEYALSEKNRELRELTHKLWLEQYINPQVSRQQLSQQLIESRIDLEVTKARRKVILDEVNQLHSRSISYAPLEANLSRLNREIQVLEQEYLEMLDKLNLARAYESNSLSSTNLKVVESAFFPLEPLPSKRKLLVLLAAAGSFAFGVVTIFGIEYLDSSIRTVQQAERATNSPVLVGLPKLKLMHSSLFEILEQPSCEEERLFKESLRSLRNHTLVSIENKKCILITSSKSREGKSLLAITLAITFSKSNSKILLVDTNFKNPCLDLMFGLSPKYTFQDVLYGKAALAEAVLKTRSSNLYVLCAQHTMASPFEINGHINLQLIMREMKNKYDFIIFDTPSMNKFSDTEELANEVDLSICVIKSGNAFTQADTRSFEMLENAKAKFHGVVLNQMNLDLMDPLFGEIDKQRSFIRVLIKKILTRQFSIINSKNSKII